MRTPCAARPVIVALLVVAALAATGPAHAASQTRLDFNIAVNPGAEAAAGGTGQVVPIPLWSRTSTMTAVRYGAPGFPTKGYATTINGQQDLFYCGRDTAGSQARQRISIVGRNAVIDAGNLKLTIAARVGTTADDGDTGQMSVKYLNANGAVIGELVLLVTPAMNTGGLMPRTVQAGPVPPNTRALRVVLRGTTATGPDCDVVWDNISVKLSKVS